VLLQARHLQSQFHVVLSPFHISAIHRLSTIVRRQDVFTHQPL
jgi:hypothetical protein